MHTTSPILFVLLESNPRMRSGGPKLTSTQAYPDRFCYRVASYHKRFCLETWLQDRDCSYIYIYLYIVMLLCVACTSHRKH